MKGRTEMGYEMGELDIGGKGGEPKICRLQSPSIE